jgi:hypothetical protein
MSITFGACVDIALHSPTTALFTCSLRFCTMPFLQGMLGMSPKVAGGIEAAATQGGDLSPQITNDVVFGIFGAENAKNNVVRY